MPEVQSAVTTSTNVSPEERPRGRSQSYLEENLNPPPRVRTSPQRLGQTTVNEEDPSPEIVAPIPRSASFRFLGQLQVRQPRFTNPLFNRDRVRIPPTPPSTSLTTGPQVATTPGGTERQVELPSRSTLRRAIRSLPVDSVEASRDRHESSDSSRTLANASTDSGADADSESSRRNATPPTRTAIIDGVRIDGASEIANALRRAVSNSALPTCQDFVFSPNRMGGPCPGCPPSGSRRPHFGTHIPHNETVPGPEEGDRDILLSRYSRLSGGPVPGFEEEYFPSTDGYFGSPRADLSFGDIRQNAEPAESEPGPSEYARRRYPRRRRAHDDADESDSSSMGGLIDREVEAEERQRHLWNRDHPNHPDPSVAAAARLQLDMYQSDSLDDDPDHWTFVPGSSRRQSWTDFRPGRLHRSSHVSIDEINQEPGLQQELRDIIARAPEPHTSAPETVYEADAEDEQQEASEHAATGPDLHMPVTVDWAEESRRRASAAAQATDPDRSDTESEGQLTARGYRRVSQANILYASESDSESRAIARAAHRILSPPSTMPSPAPEAGGPSLSLNTGDTVVRPRDPALAPPESPETSTSDGSDGLVMAPFGQQRQTNGTRGRQRERENMVLAAARVRTRERSRREAEQAIATSSDQPAAPTQRSNSNQRGRSLDRIFPRNRRPWETALHRNILFLLRRYSAIGDEEAEYALRQWDPRTLSPGSLPIEQAIDPVRLALRANTLYHALQDIERLRTNDGWPVFENHIHDDTMDLLAEVIDGSFVQAWMPAIVAGRPRSYSEAEIGIMPPGFRREILHRFEGERIGTVADPEPHDCTGVEQYSNGCQPEQAEREQVEPPPRPRRFTRANADAAHAASRQPPYYNRAWLFRNRTSIFHIGYDAILHAVRWYHELLMWDQQVNMADQDVTLMSWSRQNHENLARLIFYSRHDPSFRHLMDGRRIAPIDLVQAVESRFHRDNEAPAEQEEVGREETEGLEHANVGEHATSQPGVEPEGRSREAQPGYHLPPQLFEQRPNHSDITYDEIFFAVEWYHEQIIWNHPEQELNLVEFSEETHEQITRLIDEWRHNPGPEDTVVGPYSPMDLVRIRHTEFYRIRSSAPARPYIEDQPPLPRDIDTQGQPRPTATWPPPRLRTGESAQPEGQADAGGERRDTFAPSPGGSQTVDPDAHKNGVGHHVGEEADDEIPDHRPPP